MAQAKVGFDSRFQKVLARTLPPVCVYCGAASQGRAVGRSIPYLVPRDHALSRLPEIAVELPVCDTCRPRAGKGISAEPKDGWVILGGVAEAFAVAMAQLFDEQAAEFERGLLHQSESDEKPGGGGFDWSELK